MNGLGKYSPLCGHTLIDTGQSVKSPTKQETAQDSDSD